MTKKEKKRNEYRYIKRRANSGSEWVVKTRFVRFKGKLFLSASTTAYRDQ